MITPRRRYDPSTLTPRDASLEHAAMKAGADTQRAAQTISFLMELLGGEIQMTKELSETTTSSLAGRMFGLMALGGAAGFVTFLQASWALCKYSGMLQPRPEDPELLADPEMVVWIPCYCAAFVGTVIGASIGMFSVAFKKRKSTQPVVGGAGRSAPQP